MPLETPIVIVNFKTYPEATGRGALELSKIIEEVASENGVSAAVAPQYVDIYRIASEVKIPVLAQHVDPIAPGRNTGWVTIESVKAAGAVGTLINHSEHKLQISQIKEVVKLARKAGFATVACAADVNESTEVAKVEPDIILIEPPELVGTGIPVSKAKPEVVRNSVKAIKHINAKVKVLCGAGITAGEDVTRAIELGTEGVGVASGVVCAKDQRAAFQDIVSGIIKAR
jgi:triosephosphate isomerase